jgi:hypothetical protein
VPRAQVYDITAYILCGLLALGFICNWLVKPVADKHFMTDAELEAERRLAHEAARASDLRAAGKDASPTPAWLVAAAWLLVGIPIAWGVWVTLQKAADLFR